MTRTLPCQFAGVAIVIAIFALSLLPGPELPGVPGNDKLHHWLAYFACMFCWGQAYVLPRQRLNLAMTFVGMGVLIECLQFLSATRSFELLDMAANAAGVISAWFVVTVQLAVERRVFAKAPSLPPSPPQD